MNVLPLHLPPPLDGYNTLHKLVRVCVSFVVPAFLLADNKINFSVLTYSFILFCSSRELIEVNILSINWKIILYVLILIKNLTVYKCSKWRKSLTKNSKYFFIKSRMTDFKLEWTWAHEAYLSPDPTPRGLRPLDRHPLLTSPLNNVENRSTQQHGTQNTWTNCAKPCSMLYQSPTFFMLSYINHCYMCQRYNIVYTWPSTISLYIPRLWIFICPRSHTYDILRLYPQENTNTPWQV